MATLCDDATRMRGRHQECVLVTDGFGYLGRWIVVALLRDGYRVRAAVADPRWEAEIRGAIALHANAAGRFDIVAADVQCDAGWERAIAGCAFVLHNAAPLVAGTPRRTELAQRAQQATWRVLHAADRAGVQRVVMTAPALAALPPCGAMRRADESCWTRMETVRLDARTQMRILAERDAWAFVERHRSRMQLTTLLAGSVHGPLLGADTPASAQLLACLLNGRVRRLPRLGFDVADARDLAALHLRAMRHPDAADQRFLAVGEHMQVDEIVTLLRARFPQYAARMPTRVASGLSACLDRLFDTGVQRLAPELCRCRDYDTSKATRVLGWSPRPARDSLIDAARSLILAGQV
ncbi:nucleoside-diphosphate-sugar epimerase [Xanthomonas sp. JAI131]|uniref:NAD-dependent epimerase/dehydratase family protein n=1 Tax=Xanthomonas sp. JAI131 TaxID=2723067 RepID=UPI0015CA2B22|nr:NAD-dependent epimerase/dehydratase family protein [Xanthomonas sp. JAI131]NYF20131.1 nucleoside-diphosphate-sugar epimerase [Xanthomonas sp. JAI131]